MFLLQGMWSLVIFSMACWVFRKWNAAILDTWIHGNEGVIWFGCINKPPVEPLPTNLCVTFRFLPDLRTKQNFQDDISNTLTEKKYCNNAKMATNFPIKPAVILWIYMIPYEMSKQNYANKSNRLLSHRVLLQAAIAVIWQIVNPISRNAL